MPEQLQKKHHFVLILSKSIDDFLRLLQILTVSVDFHFNSISIFDEKSQLLFVVIY